MEYRNPQWSVNNFIDCEINHPKFGWIPFTADRNDTGTFFDVAELYDEMKEDPSILPYVPLPPEVPAQITRRQCAMMMLSQNMITGQEAISMTQSGIPPANVQAYFDAMPEPQRTMAIIDFAAINYFRDNPLLADLMIANGMTEQQVDQFFIDAASL
jgi:hypothetical protein